MLLPSVISRDQYFSTLHQTAPSQSSLCLLLPRSVTNDVTKLSDSRPRLHGADLNIFVTQLSQHVETDLSLQLSSTALYERQFLPIMHIDTGIMITLVSILSPNCKRPKHSRKTGRNGRKCLEQKKKQRASSLCHSRRSSCFSDKVPQVSCTLSDRLPR